MLLTLHIHPKFPLQEWRIIKKKKTVFQGWWKWFWIKKIISQLLDLGFYTWVWPNKIVA